MADIPFVKENVELLRDKNDVPIPQVYDPATGQMVPMEDPRIVSLSGSILQQQLTEADAVTGTLTFAENIKEIEILNTDATNAGVFNVNGLDIHVPADRSFHHPIGGTPRATVTITGATTYIVGRYS